MVSTVGAQNHLESFFKKYRFQGYTHEIAQSENSEQGLEPAQKQKQKQNKQSTPPKKKHKLENFFPIWG